jgi:hypothetical protein
MQNSARERKTEEIRNDPLTQTVHVPTGTFHNCLKSKETTPLETDLLEYKFYAPGVGNILTVDARTGNRVELVRIRRE